MRLLSRVVGTFLILIGLGFMVLLMVVARSEGLPGHLGVPAFMFGLGMLLMWIGYKFLQAESAGEGRAGQLPNLDPFLIRSRRIVEALAGTGCGLVLAHIVGACLGVAWPSEGLLWILTVAPVWTGLLAFRILAPGAFQDGLFGIEMWNHWSIATRLIVKMIMRIAWVGYIAVFFALLHLSVQVPARSRLVFDVAESSLISLLYASQFLALHFGKTREPGSNPLIRPRPDGISSPRAR